MATLRSKLMQLAAKIEELEAIPLPAVTMASWYGLLYASGLWGCSLTASKGGKGLERQQGEQALNSNGALGTLAEGWQVQSCPW